MRIPTLDELGPAVYTDVEAKRATRLTAERSHDAADCRDLLEALGLLNSEAEPPQGLVEGEPGMELSPSIPGASPKRRYSHPRRGAQ